MAADPTSLTQVALDASAQPRFTPSQMQAYFRRIGLPRKYLDSPVLAPGPAGLAAARTVEHGLPFLHALTLYHMCSITFDNLVLHYSPHRTVTLDQQSLFDKLVNTSTGGGGGRCMEQNSFLATALRSLGFEVRNVAGRVSRAMSPYPDVRRDQAATYDGWNHMLNLVALWSADSSSSSSSSSRSVWFVVDVGMGAMGPNLVYPLRDGFEAVSVAPRRIRLQYRPIAETFATTEAAATAQKLWCYDVCYKPGEDEAAQHNNEWTPVYCFAETEFLPQDYEMMSWYTSTHPRSFFTRFVTCTKMLMRQGGDGDKEEEEEEEIVGNVTLFKDAVRETIGSTRRVVRECKTEDERVQVLADVFGVHLSDEDKRSIPDDRRLG